ncbi:MAG TPA: hypothetical protein VN776_06245 [Terracidiphilus sp.]|nr:hypothetical protein [Terracidiphilus sp.]
MRYPAVLKFVAAGTMAVAMMAAPLAAIAQGSDTVLKPADMQKLLPASVYYKGQSATTQSRNSGGVKFADGFYVLATLVDTSGYSTDIQAKYSAYFITEVPIKVGGESLPAGVYGIGFIAGDKFVVTDVGAHDLLTVNSGTDAGLKRPTPLQVTADPAGGFRLYAGRRYVIFSR